MAGAWATHGAGAAAARNKGAAGVDGMTIDDLRSWIAENREGLIASLMSGSYQPKTVRGVEIPKPGGEAGMATGGVGQGMVEDVGQSACPLSHDRAVVRFDWVAKSQAVRGKRRTSVERAIRIAR